MTRLTPGVDVAVAPRKEHRFAALPVRTIAAPPPPPADLLRVLVYNLGFASGVHQETLSDKHPRSLFVRNLDSVVDYVRARDVDILLLQEVDIASSRSHYINQLEYLQDQLGWGDASSLVVWNSYVPMMGIGRVREGTAIISRYPLRQVSGHVSWFDPAFHNPIKNLLYRPFVWGTGMMHATLDVPGRPLHLFNVHLDVFQRAHRKYQIGVLIEWMHELQLERDVIVAGDFNFDAILRTYERYQAEDEQLPPAFAPLWDLELGFRELFIARDTTREAIHARPTFLEHGRRHDFLFYSRGLELDAAEVIPSLNASDHLALFAELRLG